MCRELSFNTKDNSFVGYEVDLARLRFLRWLIEQGRLEHPAYGPPAGEYAEELRPLDQDPS